MTNPFNSPYPFFQPPEDFLLAVFRGLETEIPGLVVVDEVPPDSAFTTPLLLVRGENGAWTSDSYSGNDQRFVRRFIADVQTFTAGLNGDRKGGLLSEIAHQRLRRALVDQTVYAGLGHISSVRINIPAHGVPEWATSTGPNQYATLSKGVYRYEANYGITVRPDFQNPMSEEEILSILSS